MNRPPHKLQALRQKRDQLYQDARVHPNSEADEMVRVLLLAGISSMEPESIDEEAEAAQAEERRRFRSARRARAANSEPAGPALPETEQVRFEIKERQSKLRRVAEATEQAQAAAAAGRPMDPLQVYSRIAEIIGLQSPAEAAGGRQESPKK